QSRGKLAQLQWAAQIIGLDLDRRCPAPPRSRRLPPVGLRRHRPKTLPFASSASSAAPCAGPTVLEARVGPLTISDVRRDLPAFLEGESLGCRRFKCPVRPFSNCGSRNRNSSNSWKRRSESVSPGFEELALPSGLTEPGLGEV